jgi:hypothetical protein
MKFYNNLITLICFLFICACSGPVKKNSKPDNSLNNKLLSALKGKSLKEIRELLQAQSAQFDALFKLADIRLEIIAGSSDKNNTDEGVIREPLYRITPAAAVEDGLKDLSSNFTFQQEIKPDGSSLLTYLANDYTAPDFYSRDNNKAVLNTTVTIQKLYLHDHSGAKYTETTEKIDDPVQLTSRKPIDSITARLTFNIVNKVERAILSKDEPKKDIGGGFVELKQMGGNSARIMISGHTERVLAVAGIDAKGRIIDQNSTSSNSLPSPAKRKYFEELNKLLKSAVADIGAGKYKTTDELIAAMKPKLPPGPAEDELSAQNDLLSSYHFYQDISKIVVYYASEVKDIMHTVTLKNQQVIACGLALAQGDKEGINGIINADGSWLIKPVYSNLIEINPYYYKSCKGSSDNTCDFYRLNPGNKKLINFKDTRLAGYAAGAALGMENVIFFKIDPADLTVPPKGLLNKNGEVILKPLYDLIDHAGNYLLTARENPKTQKNEFSLFTKTGVPVIAASEEAIGHDGQFIFVRQKTSADDEVKKYQLLDKNTGKSFLPAGLYSQETNWHEGLMLVGSGKDQFFIDRTKTKKIDVSQYTIVKPFSHGYANVKSSKGFWGIMNTKGDLVLGCTYDQVSTVYNNLCLLSDRGTDQKERYGLFNVVTGDMVVPMMAYDGYGSVHGEGATTTYYIGGKIYDAFGKEVKR